MGKYKVLIPLTEEEYDEYLKVKNKYGEVLGKMTVEERKKFFKKLLEVSPVTFEKEIDGTVYRVSTHFNSQAKTSVTNRIVRLIEQNDEK